MTLAQQIQKSEVQQPVKRTEPVWKGPEEDGITISLLSRFLVCRERFRIHAIEGLRPVDSFSHRIEYGNMWHVCEEALAAEKIIHFGSISTLWEGPLKDYARELCRRYMTAQDQIDHWYNVCKVQFPIYVEYWSKHPDVKNRTPLLQEQVFCVPYTLPSGRVVKLRGKWDAVDLINARVPCTCGADRTGPSAEAHSKGCPAGKPHTTYGAPGIYIQENKTKGDIDIVKIERQLSCDLQSMFYLISLQRAIEIDTDRSDPEVGVFCEFPKNRVSGVRYNVVRRPLSGGKGTIRQHQPTKSNPHGESKESFYARLSGIIKDSPEEYFMRRKVDVLPHDIEKFKRQCLNPILEQLCDWYKIVSKSYERNLSPWDYVPKDGKMYNHWRMPYGTYSSIIEGTGGDLDAYLETGNEVGLQCVTELFPELQ